MPSRANEDTIVALATPVGTSALAVVRASGPECSRLAGSLLGKPLGPRRVVHGDYHTIDGALLDDVVAIYYLGPASYTGEDTIEISSHGNPYIAQRIVEDLCCRGCRPASPGEFTQRAFLNGRMDLSQAEAVMDVIQARSERSLAVAQKQLKGSLGRHIGPLNALLINILARIEAYIDFPEEDLPPEDRESMGRDLESVLRGTGRLLATGPYGAMLRNGIGVVIVGAPNAGKSSLLNRLVGFYRALVSSTPGTTRDFIEESLRVGSHWIRLIDTAGLGVEQVGLERLGMEKARERAREADILLWVIDASTPHPSLESELAGTMRPGNTLVVFNKTDLLTEKAFDISVARERKLPLDFRSVSISAATGAGIDELTQAIADLADAFQVTVGDEAIAVNARHAHALKRALESLEAARRKIWGGGLAMELLASDLRAALEAFGEILGRFDHERVLDSLFSHFCIGK